MLPNKDTLIALDKAGEALKATGLDHVTMTLNRDGSFSIGLKSDPHVFGADCFGFSGTPSVAYIQAVEQQEPKAHEIAIRNEIERRVRAELDGEHREAA